MAFLKYALILEDAVGSLYILDNSALHIDSSGHLEQEKRSDLTSNLIFSA